MNRFLQIRDLVSLVVILASLFMLWQTVRALNISDDWLYPVEAQARADWTVIDFGRRRGELLRQAARVDGASLRVVERSEFIALQVSRQYLNLLLQQRIVAAAEDNALFHQQLAGSLSEGVDQGSISVADLQQAEERLERGPLECRESLDRNAQRLAHVLVFFVSLAMRALGAGAASGGGIARGGGPS